MTRIIAILTIAIVVPACAPSYTWGYAPTIHPASTKAYILAVMAREAGDAQTALYYYDAALSHTYSQKVADERDEVRRSLRNP